MQEVKIKNFIKYIYYNLETIRYSIMKKKHYIIINEYYDGKF